LVSHSGLITVMQRAARKAAPRIRRDFGEVEQLQVSRKGPADFVSMADKRAERRCVEELRMRGPIGASTGGRRHDRGRSLEAALDHRSRSTAPPTSSTAFPHFSISIAVEEPAGGRQARSPRASSTSR
jgi:myo-inositol-1(or 4)-monophosphatase